MRLRSIIIVCVRQTYTMASNHPPTPTHLKQSHNHPSFPEPDSPHLPRWSHDSQESPYYSTLHPNQAYIYASSPLVPHASMSKFAPLDEIRSIEMSEEKMSRRGFRRLESLGLKNIQESVSGEYQDLKTQNSQLRTLVEQLNGQVEYLLCSQQRLKQQLEQLKCKLTETVIEKQRNKLQVEVKSSELVRVKEEVATKENENRILTNNAQKLTISEAIKVQEISNLTGELNSLKEQLQSLKVTHQAQKKQLEETLVSLRQNFELAKSIGQDQIDRLLLELTSPNQVHSKKRTKTSGKVKTKTSFMDDDDYDIERKASDNTQAGSPLTCNNFVNRFKTFQKLINRRLEPPQTQSQLIESQSSKQNPTVLAPTPTHKKTNSSIHLCNQNLTNILRHTRTISQQLGHLENKVVPQF